MEIKYDDEVVRVDRGLEWNTATCSIRAIIIG